MISSSFDLIKLTLSDPSSFDNSAIQPIRKAANLIICEIRLPTECLHLIANSAQLIKYCFEDDSQVGRLSGKLLKQLVRDHLHEHGVIILRSRILSHTVPTAAVCVSYLLIS